MNLPTFEETKTLIWQLRQAGVTKYRMAQIAQVTWQSIHNWEQGKTVPHGGELKVLQELLESVGGRDVEKDKDRNKKVL